jgi:hypothetical protein
VTATVATEAMIHRENRLGRNEDFFTDMRSSSNDRGKNNGKRSQAEQCRLGGGTSAARRIGSTGIHYIEVATQMRPRKRPRKLTVSDVRGQELDSAVIPAEDHIE